MAKQSRARPLPSTSELKRIFRYDRSVGRLYWRHRSDVNKTWNIRFPGTEAGTPDSRGYRSVLISGKRFWVHRIIFKIVNGFEPIEVDHRNLDKRNNGHKNLRAATVSQNRCNRAAKPRSLPKGVYQVGNRFEAKIGRHYLGLFTQPAAAHAAYCAAAAKLYGQFARFD